MNVSELIEKLKLMPADATVGFETEETDEDGGYFTRIDRADLEGKTQGFKVVVLR